MSQEKAMNWEVDLFQRMAYTEHILIQRTGELQKNFPAETGKIEGVNHAFNSISRTCLIPSLSAYSLLILINPLCLLSC